MPLSPLNYVNLGPHGTFQRSGNYHTTPQDVDAIFNHMTSQNVSKLTLYFHGGLVNENGGMLSAERMADFGRWVWDGMKATAQKMWASNHDLSGEALHGGRYFLEKLSEYRQKHEVLVDLVGHSAGAIVIGNCLKTIADNNLSLPIRNIIFLAPACTIDLLHDEIIAKPERYQHFRMFTMMDRYEMEDRLVPYVYTRSLLYFISGVLEDEADKPIAGLDHHTQSNAPFAGRWINDISTFLRNDHHLVLSVTGPNSQQGLQSASKSHPDFDNDPETLESLKAITKQP